MPRKGGACLMKSPFSDFNRTRRFQTWAAFCLRLEFFWSLKISMHIWKQKKEIQTNIKYF